MSKQNKSNILKKILKAIIAIVFCLAIVFVLLVTYFSITEYRPGDVETLKILNNASEEISKDKEISMMT